MPRPEPKEITFEIDGREVEVPKGTGLVETAMQAGVEIPVFCYEPRLGPPVGACRMCLVEIEGMPKLQAGCTLTAQDGMVVKTAQTSELAKFYQHESCGKCTPCREGTRWTVSMLERVDSGLATPMDLDIMASVQEQIIGKCLCVLGDAMAMPIGSMVAKFRDEFEAHIEAARARNPYGGDVPDPEPLLVQGAPGA